MNNKIYYKKIDIIRILACIAILLYHLNILKGGYLAVCTFFVLSGYLSFTTTYKKENFSLKNYYCNKFNKIYIPLIIVVFVTISIVSFLPNISWLNLKKETTSILLGYNNFWQLSTNLDYFARHINSPFIHLWYIAILLQFYLIFPFIYIFIRKIGNKFNKNLPLIVTSILSVIFSIYFYKSSLSSNIMTVYYNTFTRIFSILFGLTTAIIHSHYKPLIPKKFQNKTISSIIFYLYILILLPMFIFIVPNSTYFAVSMILVSLISCRLIDYGTIIIKNNPSISNKIINSLSKKSYGIYLLQYPIIFIFQSFNINNNYSNILIIILTVLLSYLLHYILEFNKQKKINKTFQYILLIITIIISLHGAYKYIISESHTKEMKELEAQLELNKQMMISKQEEYKNTNAKEEKEWLETLTNIENQEKKFKDYIINLPVIGLGDSVMLGAVKNLYSKFPNGYFDAAISRTCYVVNDILIKLKNKNMLKEPIVLNFGANGDCSETCKIKIMETTKDKKVFWINTTNYENVNKKLNNFATKYPNLYIIDWKAISKEHKEYFYADKIHLTPTGRTSYTEVIYNAIYDVYYKEYQQKKEELLNNHENLLKEKITFYGNNILLNAFDYIEKEFPKANFIIKSEFDYQTLKTKIEKEIEEETLNHKIVFAFDKQLNLNIDEYQELIELCKKHKIYILTMDEKTAKKINNLNKENVEVINFHEIINFNKEYLMPDQIHLTDSGNIALNNTLIKILKKSQE